MGLSHPQLLLLFSHLAFLLVSSSAQLSPAPAPSHHRKHHDHSLRKPHPHPAPAYAPSKPPVPPPVKLPTKPPAVQPPVKLPTKPPAAQPPAKTPTKPPTVQPPAKTPTKPPAVQPPAKTPTKPPAVQPPVKTPTKPPVPPPVKPPTTPPVKPPTPSIPLPRKLVAVQGVVYCKNCTYIGKDTLNGANALPGATVLLTCRTLKSQVAKNATTDKNGYFFIEAPKGVVDYKVTKYCHVYLSAAPAGAKCRSRSNLNGGREGALLQPAKPLVPPAPFSIYNVGPFAFEPPKRHCPKPDSGEDVVHVQSQLAR